MTRISFRIACAFAVTACAAAGLGCGAPKPSGGAALDVEAPGDVPGGEGDATAQNAGDAGAAGDGAAAPDGTKPDLKSEVVDAKGDVPNDAALGDDGAAVDAGPPEKDCGGASREGCPCNKFGDDCCITGDHGMTCWAVAGKLMWKRGLSDCCQWSPYGKYCNPKVPQPKLPWCDEPWK